MKTDIYIDFGLKKAANGTKRVAIELKWERECNDNDNKPCQIELEVIKKCEQPAIISCNTANLLSLIWNIENVMNSNQR